ncbi:MAG: hypothetical protein R2795_12085 [Saprospiraceae bacterium]
MNNRFFTEDIFLEVPWSNKQLEVVYETFRSQLYLCAEEKWVLRIDAPNQQSPLRSY